MSDFAHWSDLERQKFLDAVQSSVFFCENNLSKLKAVPKTANTPTSCADADAKQKEFYDVRFSPFFWLILSDFGD